MAESFRHLRFVDSKINPNGPTKQIPVRFVGASKVKQNEEKKNN